MTASDQVREHYQAAIDDRAALLSRIGAAVDAIDAPITAARLARLDQFHMGGLAATAALASRVEITSEIAVLDAGSGLGGPARYLAETYGCRVAGVDLARDYVAIAQLLTERAGLTDRVGFRVGDLIDLEFEDGAFDLVWSQHVAMNITDRDRLYGELRRVTAKGGRFAFFDPIAADDGARPYYPVPWAVTEETSTLLTENETRSVLERKGFRIIALDDVTSDAIGWAIQQGPPTSADPTAVMIVGARMAEMAGNFMRSLREGRARLMMGVCEAV